jgi:hypothetical protein
MNLPLELITGNLFSDKFYICYFRDLRHKKESPPHFHVLVPVSNATFLCLCIITTKFENLSEYYNREGEEKALECLVYIDSSDFAFLTASRGCVINCNVAEIVDKDGLDRIIDKKYGFQIKANHDDFSAELKVKILNAIDESPIVKGYVKKMIATR